MATANVELLDSAIFRSLKLRGVEDRIALAVAQVMRDEVLPDIARQLNKLPFNQLAAGDFRLIALRNAIQEGMGWDRVTVPLTQSLRDMTADEAAAALAQLDDALPGRLTSNLTLQLITPGPDLLISTVMERPFNDTLMSEWFAKLGEEVQGELYEAFRVGMVEGKSIPKMAADLLERNYAAFTTGGVKNAIDNAMSVARTAANLVQNRARETMYAANSDIVKAVEYIATLDDATTFICMDLHGNVYPVGQGERPPQHFQCRSTTVPVLKSWEEMGIPRKDLTRREMASLDGRVPKPRSFDDWINTKGKGTQDRLLGKVRADMWRAGRVQSVKDFVNIDGSTKTLKEFGLNLAGNPLELTV